VADPDRKEGDTMSSKYSVFVGIDWATESHQVCVMNPGAKTLCERSVQHTGDALAELAETLLRFCDDDPRRGAIAIETNRGAVVETLLERGFHVFSINPKQLDRFRDRHTVAGAKDDSLDAFVLADSLRTDEHCFRRLRIDSPSIIQLREISRLSDELREELNRLSNRLREQLLRYYPAMLKLCPAADEPWFWSLLEMAPAPENALRLRAGRIQEVLKKHRIRRLNAEQILSQIKAKPLVVARGTVEAACFHIESLIPRLRMVHAQRQKCLDRVDAMFESDSIEQNDNTEKLDAEKREHRDIDIIRSMPGIGKIIAATMLAEASQALEERDYHVLRSLGGVAPVTRRSGKKCIVIMRRACNEKLRNAFYHWGRCAVLWDPASRDLYATLRARGQKHGRALRSVVDRLLRILAAALRSNTLFNPKMNLEKSTKEAVA
jgi:transposase